MARRRWFDPTAIAIALLCGVVGSGCGSPSRIVTVTNESESSHIVRIDAEGSVRTWIVNPGAGRSQLVHERWPLADATITVLRRGPCEVLFSEGLPGVSVVLSIESGPFVPDEPFTYRILLTAAPALAPDAEALPESNECTEALETR
jgi:hypothetical protein